MNKHTSWALATLCLTGILGCRLLPPTQRCSHAVSSISYAEGPNCSWEAGQTSPSAAESKSFDRVPYGFRWDDYQGSDIEHDIYGDRQRTPCLGTMTHPHLVAGVSQRISGVLCNSRSQGCAAKPCANHPTNGQAGEFGCEALLAIPEVPPLTIVPPVPEANPPAVESRPLSPQVAEPSSPEPPPSEPQLAEPTPANSKEVSPRNLVPIPLPLKSATPSDGPQETPSLRLEPSPAVPLPMTQLPAAQPLGGVRLLPTLIVPAVPPDSLKESPSSESSRPALPRNKIPAKTLDNSGK